MRALGLLLAGTLACGLPRADAPLALAPETLAVVLLTTHDGAPVAIAYPALEAPPKPLLDADAELYALEYADSLEALGLRAGLVELAEDGDALPPPARISGLAEGSRWEQTQARPPLFDRARTAPRACPASSACTRAFGSPPVYRCSEVCGAPVEALPPRAPEPPASPEAPRWGPCTGAAIVRAGGGVSWCEPPPRASCARGSWQAWDAAACAALADCAAMTIPADAVWASPGTSGGDGTRARPFGPQELAGVQLGPGRALALSGAGAFPSFALPRGVSLLASCDAQIVFEPDGDGVALRASDGLIRGVTLAGTLVVEGALVVERSTLEGPGVPAIEARPGASLGLRLASVRGPVLLGEGVALEASDVGIDGGVIASARAQLGLERAIVARDTSAAIEGNGASISIARSSVRGAREAMLVRDGSLAVDEVHASGRVVAVSSALAGHGLVVGVDDDSALGVFGSSVAVEDVVVERAKGIALVVESSTASVARLSVLAPETALLVARSAAVSLQDVSTLSLGPAALDAYGSNVALSRARFSGLTLCEGGALRLTDITQLGSPNRLRVSDRCHLQMAHARWEGFILLEGTEPGSMASMELVDAVIDAKGGGPALVLEDRSVTQVERALLLGTTKHAIEVRAGGQLTATDVDIDASAASFGIQLESARASFERLRVRGGGTALSALSSQVVGVDVSLESPADVGASFGEGARPSLTRARISGAGVGLSLSGTELSEDAGPIELSGCAVGLELSVEVPWSEALAAVSLRGVETPLRRR